MRRKQQPQEQAEPEARTGVQTPYQRIVSRSERAQAEEVELAKELVHVLETQEDHPVWGQGNWLGLVERWESAETVIAALRLCLVIVRDQEPLSRHNLARQLRHWRRLQGKSDLGWLEVREVNGAGPYLYYRYREPGSRTLHTEYYGRADRALLALIDLPLEGDVREAKKTARKPQGERDLE